MSGVPEGRRRTTSRCFYKSIEDFIDTTIVTFREESKRNAHISYKSELFNSERCIKLNMVTASREWRTGGTPTNY